MYYYRLQINWVFLTKKYLVLGALRLLPTDTVLFATETSRPSLHNILADETMGLSFMNRLGLFPVHLSRRTAVQAL
jgi:hypothetical protein